MLLKLKRTSGSVLETVDLDHWQVDFVYVDLLDVPEREKVGNEASAHVEIVARARSRGTRNCAPRVVQINWAGLAESLAYCVPERPKARLEGGVLLRRFLEPSEQGVGVEKRNLPLVVLQDTGCLVLRQVVQVGSRDGADKSGVGRRQRAERVLDNLDEFRAQG